MLSRRPRSGPSLSGLCGPSPQALCAATTAIPIMITTAAASVEERHFYLSGRKKLSRDFPLATALVPAAREGTWPSWPTPGDGSRRARDSAGHSLTALRSLWSCSEATEPRALLFHIPASLLPDCCLSWLEEPYGCPRTILKTLM